MPQYILRGIEDAASATIAKYEALGGYKSLGRALGMKPAEVIEEVKKAGLRGRGGAGFPTAAKWGYSAADKKTPRYIVCNADEGEPGTFKDKPILERNPHILIEGMAIAGYAVGATMGIIYLRGEYPHAMGIMEAAIAEARAKGYLGPDVMGKGLCQFDLMVHMGAGAYICGEETALLESLEGRRGQPRIKPPFPVNEGYLAKPTVVNNVETLANVTVIMEIGADAYAAIGPKTSPGPKLFSVSGHVVRPGVYELPMGTSLKTLIYDICGGIPGGKALKGVIPGGVSTPVLTPDKIDVALDFQSMSTVGSMLGSGAVMVFDETTCMVGVAYRIAEFFEVESCGKCTPCREGTGWLRAILGRIEHGKGHEGDLKLLSEVADSIAGKSFCALGDSAAAAALGFLRNYTAEFEAHVKAGRCTVKGK